MAEDAVTQADLTRMQAQLTTVFTPGAPVAERELLAGRIPEIRETIRAVSQQGLHAAIFGERGVGKTSLARFIHEIWSDISRDLNVIAARVPCDSTDDFQSIWKEAAIEIRLSFEKRGDDVSAIPGSKAFAAALDELELGNATPGLVRRALDLDGYMFIVVVDEYDRLPEGDTSRLMADTIKTLSDQLVVATIIIVGVAETVDGLFEEHESINRSLVQILIPRMTPTELEEIVQTRLGRLGMTIPPDVSARIASLCSGLPNYAHLLGLHTGLEAVGAKRTALRLTDFGNGLGSAIDTMKQTLGNDYYLATRSTQKSARYHEVLLACALTRPDERGYFAPRDVRDPLGKLRGKPVEITDFMRHLREFIDETRGRIIQKSKSDGTRPMYRFKDPLMQPYVVLRGINETTIPNELLHSVGLYF